jgi:hypothetical protein
MDRAPIHEIQPESIEILGEQWDGETEIEFKRLVRKIFESQPAVAAAYLLRVQYPGEDAVSIALGIRFVGDHIDEGAINEAGLAFHTTFSGSEHLDIIPLNESAIGEVNANPFYVARFEPTG